MKPLWPHQKRAVQLILEAAGRDERKLILACPTGGGKTRIDEELIREFVIDRQGKAVMYTNRKLLVEQLHAVMKAAGLKHGVRAADHEDERCFNFQISSIQTEHARVLKSKRWELHEADLAIIDEAHLNNGEAAQAIVAAHWKAGALVILQTATPLDLEICADALILAGTNSELRACGALVPCQHFGCGEPDLRFIRKRVLGDDLTERQASKAMMVPGIFGRVFEEYCRINPERKASILFAPGVKESIWFAEQFHSKGVTVAHIDGADVWLNGKLYRTSKEARKDVLEGSRDGSITLLCNRFVLREGVDAPWLSHGIMATVFGSLQSYLQSGGRLLRSSPGLDHVTLQDHGGNWHRHGSLNADRIWNLGDSSRLLAAKREDALRGKDPKIPEPFVCPQCKTVLATKGQIVQCPCGYEILYSKRSRPVYEQDGSLKEMVGDIYQPRKVCQDQSLAKEWERMYYRSKNSDRTFRAAEALFAQEHNWQWPSRAWPLMPKRVEDFYRKVADVPREQLR